MNQWIWWSRSKRITDGSGMIRPRFTWTTSSAPVRIVRPATVKGFASRGRPRTINEANAEQVKQDQQQGRDDATARMAVEGKFGQGKRRFGLGRLMAKLAVTSEAMIQVSFLVMNLEHLLARGIFSWLASWWQSWLVPGKAGLVAKRDTRKADVSERSGGGLAARGARMSQLAA